MLNTGSLGLRQWGLGIGHSLLIGHWSFSGPARSRECARSRSVMETLTLFDSLITSFVVSERHVPLLAPRAALTKVFAKRWATVALLLACAVTGQSQEQAERGASSKPAGRPWPFIQVTTNTVNTNRIIFVEGEVSRPGRFVWTNGLAITNAIALAGGFTDFADRSRLEIRRSDGGIERYNFSRIIRGLTNNPVLRPYDQIYVRKRFW